MPPNWRRKIEEYCEKYNIPLGYLSNTLYEPKVIPMIRGKAFEFTVMLALQNILPEDTWRVTKIPINAQRGLHDTDVLVTHIPTQREINVECKLAKKEGFIISNNNKVSIKVKCMRSRTLGDSMVETLAPQLNVTPEQLSVHNDQYLPEDFDLVVTSIGNTFYRTNEETGIFEWRPTEDETNFLNLLGANQTDNLKTFAFNKLFIILSSSLRISRETGIECTRRRCRTRRICGFIPNYPIIQFPPRAQQPNNGWVSIENSEALFEQLTH